MKNDKVEWGNREREKRGNVKATTWSLALDKLKGIVLIGIGFLANIYGPNFSLS